MSEVPYIPFYTSDFLGGTSGMTAATKGVYITLLCLMYETERPLSQQWDTLARRCGCTLPAFKKSIEALQDDGKITVTDAGLWSAKCDKHMTQRRERRISATSAAKKRWEKTKQKQGNENATASPAQCQPEPEPELDNSEPNGSDGAAVIADATKDAIWKRGVPYLVENGVPERQARSAIGKWIRDAGAQRLYDALAQSKSSGTGDPIPYITEILKPEPDNEQIMRDIVARVRARRREGASA